MLTAIPLAAILVVTMWRSGPVPETYTYPMYDYGACAGLRDYIVASPIVVSAKCYPKPDSK
jgi:hypothetical protein